MVDWSWGDQITPTSILPVPAFVVVATTAEEAKGEGDKNP